MAAKLLFIHGTGVRQSGYHQTMADLAAGLAKAGRKDIVVDGVPWGDTFGVAVDDDAITDVLPLAQKKGFGGDWEAALWAELLKDPLLELRMAAMREVAPPDPQNPVLPGGGRPAYAQVDDRLTAVQQKLSDPMPGGVPAQTLREAAEWLRAQTVVQKAAAAAPSASDPDLIDALAQAIVAKALAEMIGQVGVGPDALYVMDERRALVRAIAGLLAPQTKGLRGWLQDQVKELAEARATSFGKGRRVDLMRGVTPGIGDILLYQRRGDDILAAIGARIMDLAKDETPLVVLGHSLGGIMLVDLLSRPRPAGRLPVVQLITVGSQAPVLFKFDALGSLRLPAGASAGKPFTPWLNIFDRNDFLSFCASRAFPGVTTGVDDVEVASGVPFPEAHGAYFRLPAFYRELARACP